jgi:hypothetical protein
MEVGENNVRVFYGTEKREGERLEIYTGGISPCSRDHVSDPMIPPVRTDPVWGRAWSGPVPPEGRTGLGPRLAVLDWTGLVWTSPNRIILINFKVDRKLKK